MNLENARELAMAPDIWEIRLRDGTLLKVLSHAYRIEHDEAVFLLLFEGSPPFYVDSLRIPLSLLPVDFS